MPPQHKPQPTAISPLRLPPILFAILFVYAAGMLFSLWWRQAPINPGLFLEYWRRDAHFLIPTWGGFFTTWAGNGVAMMLLALLELASWGAGRYALRWVLGRVLAGHWGILLSLGLGNGLLGMVVLGFGLMGLLHPGILWIVLAVPAGLGVQRIVSTRADWPDPATWRQQTVTKLNSFTWVEWLLLAMSLLILFPNYLSALQPEQFYDSLVYHMAEPEQYLLEHKICNLSISSNLPFMQEMQYALLLGLGSDIACKLLHWMDGVLCALAVYTLARTLMGRSAGLLAMAVFLSQPPLRFLQYATMVELKLALFEFLATMAFIQAMGWRVPTGSNIKGIPAGERPSSGGWLFLTGWFLAFAHGTKYLGIFSTVLLVTWWIIEKRRVNRTQMVRYVFPAICWITLWTLPWLVKSWLFTRDPFFPLLQNVFPAVHWNEDMHQQWMSANTRHGMGHGNWLNWLLLPVNASTETSSFGSFTLNPFALLFLPLMALFRSPPAPQRFLAAYAGLFAAIWAMTSQQTRYLLPMMPQAAVAVAFLVTRIGSGVWLVKILLSIPVIWILIVSAFGQVHNRFSNSSLWPYTMGHMDRQKFLSTYVSYYDTLARANQVVGRRDRLMLLGEGESFYCHRRRFRNNYFDRPEIGELVKQAASSEALLRSLERLRVTHFLVHTMRTGEHLGYGLFDWGRAGRERFLELWASHLQLISANNGVFLFELTKTPLPLHERKRGTPPYFYPRAIQTQASTLINQVEQLFRLGRRQEAYEMTGAIVRLLPEAALAHSYRAYASSLVNKRKEAIAEYAEAIRVGYPPADIYYNLGLLLYDEHNYAEALERILEALRLDPNTAQGRAQELVEQLRKLIQQPS